MLCFGAFVSVNFFPFLQFAIGRIVCDIQKSLKLLGKRRSSLNPYFGHGPTENVLEELEWMFNIIDQSQVLTLAVGITNIAGLPHLHMASVALPFFWVS